MADSEIEIIDTRITNHWGVDWNAMEIVRDFLQNFYDASPVNEIRIEIKDRTVTVSSPSEFDYKSLLYLGSDKGTSDIGQYGEGFKAATLNAMRNHGCNVLVHIKDILLDFYFEAEKIGETEKKIIKCKKSKVAKIKGTKLILKNCSKDILEEFKFGMNYFHSENNPLFGTVLAKSYHNDIIIYKSSVKNVGYVFYKKLLRAKIDIPLVIVCNRKYKSIDGKIKHDRDRKAFDDKVLELLLKYIFKNLYLEPIINELKPWWEGGHKILRYMASGGYRSISIEFPDNYYAKQTNVARMNTTMLIEIKNIEHEFQKNNFIQCPGYLSNLGMNNAESVILKRLKEKREERETLFTRSPTELELEALNILKNYIHGIEPFLTNKFQNAYYTIGDTEELIGELRLNRHFRSHDVFLSKKFFLFNFSLALSILLHEWAHIYGFDGSRGFTDGLTGFLSELIERRNELDDVEIKWNQISGKIAKSQFQENSYNKVHTIIGKLSNKQKIQLLKSIPEDELLKLIIKEDIDISSLK